MHRLELQAVRNRHPDGRQRRKAEAPHPGRTEGRSLRIAAGRAGQPRPNRPKAIPKNLEKSQGAAPPSNDNGGGGNGNADKGNSPGGNNGSNQAPTGIEDEKSLGGTTQGQNASHSQTAGGSSPLVPILIAIAVLAAISIGAVVYRQRRQGSGGTGSPVSPNA